MGRQAKLRQQRKQAERSPEPSTAPSTNSAPSKPQSGISKFLKRLNPFSKDTEDLSWLEDDRDYIEQNNRRASEIALAGYPTQKRGFVLAVESEKSAPQLEYRPRRTLEATLRQYRVPKSERNTIANLVKSYDPKGSFVLVYCDRDQAVTASTCLLSSE
jgi:hypothetical protein